MPVFRVETAARRYPVIVERGALKQLSHHLPPRHGKIFIVTTTDVWSLHGSKGTEALELLPHHVLAFPGGETNKRLCAVEALAEQMMRHGADRSSVIVAFGGGIVNDIAGFLAAIFMRGIPVIQAPTTLLAQVDAAVGGKTGANLESGKNLLGAFHQPLAVLIDPAVLDTLPEREYRAGLYEVVKCGIIRDRELVELFDLESAAIKRREPQVVDRLIASAVKIKCEVVSADERENDLRRILNFGHTVGHALEAETGYSRFLHGEAVAFGMHAAVELSRRAAGLSEVEANRMRYVIRSVGAIPGLEGVSADALMARLTMDKKTVQGKIHFVLTPRAGETVIAAGLPDGVVRESIEAACA